MMSERRQVKKSFWWKLGLVPFVMFAFAYAMVPLYDVLCEITGLNGKTGTIEMTKTYDINKDRKIKVDFFASTMRDFPVDFKPKISFMEVVPGKFYTMHYIAKNSTDKTIIGQAVPSVAPNNAALHFKKLECFCFTKQVFKPQERIDMVVRFVVDPKIEVEIKDISLSYNFFKIS